MNQGRHILKQKESKRIIYGFFALFVIILLNIGIFNHLKPLPDGLSYESEIYYTDEV